MATKYRVISPLVLLPYYPDPDTGRPLPASRNSSENSMRDEYGRNKVGHLKLKAGSEFYTGDNAPDEVFHTFDQSTVDRFLRLNAVEEADSGEEAQASNEQPEVKKESPKKASKASAAE